MEPGFELYSAPFATIVTACSSELGLSALRRGEISQSFVRFCPEVAAADVLLLSTAFGVRLKTLLNFEVTREETALGLFIDRVDPHWVKAVASTSEASAGEIEQLWQRAFVEQEQRQPDWAHVHQENEIRNAIRVCRSATIAKTDVVMVWSL